MTTVFHMLGNLSACFFSLLFFLSPEYVKESTHKMVSMFWTFNWCLWE